MKDRRFIEETFPIEEVSAESAREKSIRHGHISTLHIWWARRPLASSRTTIYAALTPVPQKLDVKRKKQFIVKLSKWKNALNAELIEEARKDILRANSGRRVRVLDPFAGGGAIPLEALRLGCEVYSSDYNPVAVMLQKCTLEYPQKFQERREGTTPWTELNPAPSKNFLLQDIDRWGKWVFKKAMSELGGYYPSDPDGSIPVGYFWARTILCTNPACNAEIPLMKQFWLAKKPKKKVAIFPYSRDGEVRFRIVGDGYDEMPSNFEPGKGTISKAIVTCIQCGSSTEAKTVKTLFNQGKAGERMIGVVLHRSDKPGKSYRVATSEDRELFRKTEESLESKRRDLFQEWGIDPVPDELIHTPDHQEYRPGGLLYNFTPVLLYGMTRWGDLFNSRQRLALVTIVDKIRKAYVLMLEGGLGEERAIAVSSYLALALDRLANQCCSMARWHNTGEKIEGIFSRQALTMVWDYVEVNPFSRATGDWNSAMGWIKRVVDHASQTSLLPATVVQASATSLPYPDDHFDAVFTDPPYYDNVPYADLSDFFYVWLKRTIGHLYPALFSTPTAPKTNEAIAELPLLRGVRKSKAGEIVSGIKTKQHFESAIQKALREIHRVLKANGIAVIVYAHKTTAGWETLINSLLDSSLIVTGAWPLHTEMRSRLRARESAALASSIYIVARKMQREATGFYNDVRGELSSYLESKLDRLWSEGLGGADFFIAAIGSAIEVFGKYEKVMDYEGNIVRADRLLEDVQEIATNYAVRQILHNGLGREISDLTRLYVLWRWEFGSVRVPFDDSRKLAQSCGIDLSQEWNRDGFVRKEKEFIRVLGPHERTVERLENSQELVDILHLALLLWEKGKMDEMTTVLSESGFGDEAFFRVAQAISQTLPNDSKEKKLLDGFLAGRERVTEEVRRKTVQTKLM